MKIDPHTLEFELPEQLIAQEALAQRDAARLMIIDRAAGSIQNRIFNEIGAFLRRGDVLVLNQAKVVHAKLWARKETGGKVELILIEESTPGTWVTLVRPFMKEGTEFLLEGGGRGKIIGRSRLGENMVQFSDVDIVARLKEAGDVPLPPYIRRAPNDERRKTDLTDYQTVYASHSGSIAAPTAGLHFTPELLAALQKNGVELVKLTLHVGWGTFRPIAQSVDAHEMLSEKFEISAESIQKIGAAHAQKRRVIAVGTTATRVLESLAQSDFSAPAEKKGETNLFIKPGHKFKNVSALLTNFHTPRSTPLSLVSAFAGHELIESAYAQAIAEKYRFFSYGDAMLIQ